MVNKNDFAKRLKKLLDFYEISASALADKIDVQRSSISHLLSGRNNASLEFILKILDNYPEVDFNWLVKGIGEIGTSVSNITDAPTLFDQEATTKAPVFSKELPPTKKLVTNKLLSKIVFFYTDGSFEIYQQ